MNLKFRHLSQLSLALAAGLILFVSCKVEIPEIEDELDPNWQPTFAIPLGGGTIQLGDLINQLEDSLISEDPNTGGFNILYSEKDVFKYAISDMASIPENQSINLDPISIADFDLSNVSFSVNSETRFGDVVSDMATQMAEDLSQPPFLIITPEMILSSIKEGENFQYDIPATKPNVAPQLYTAPELTGIELMSGKMDITLENGFQFDVKRFKGALIEKASGDTIDTTGDPIDLKKGEVTIITMEFGEDLDFTTGLEFVVLNLEVDAVPKNSFVYHADDAFKVDATVNDLTVELENSMASEFPTDFEGVSDLKLHVVEVQSGNIEMTLNSGIPVDGTLNLEFKNIVDASSGMPVKESFELDKGKFKSPAIISLVDRNIDFTKTSGTANTLNFAYSFTAKNAETYTNVSDASAQVGVDIKGLKVDKIIGDLGRVSVEIDPASMDMDLELFDQIKGKFVLAAPKLSMILKNPAIDAEMNILLDATAKGDDKEIKMKHSNIPGSTEMFIHNIARHSVINGPVDADSINLTKENSNLQEIISLPPTKGFTFEGSLTLNPNGVNPLTPNVIIPDSTISLDLEMEMPLSLQTDSLVFSEIQDTDPMEDDLKGVEELTVVLSGSNGMPLGVKFELFFLDSDSNIIPGTEPILFDSLQPANVNENGDVTSPTTFQDLKIVVGKGQIKGLEEAENYEYRATMFTPDDGNGGSKPGRIGSTNSLTVSLYLEATVNGSALIESED